MTIRDLPVPIGDAAQVRKALEVIRSKAVFMKGMYNVPNSLVMNLMEIIAIANTALAAPARNADVGTAEEHIKRFREFCLKYPCCQGCQLLGTKPLHDVGGIHCWSHWAQMPYNKEGKTE